jgi:hypothetical protein
MQRRDCLSGNAQDSAGGGSIGPTVGVWLGRDREDNDGTGTHSGEWNLDTAFGYWLSFLSEFVMIQADAKLSIPLTLNLGMTADDS